MVNGGVPIQMHEASLELIAYWAVEDLLLHWRREDPDERQREKGKLGMRERVEEWAGRICSVWRGERVIERERGWG